jgi:hypothetical protein
MSEHELEEYAASLIIKHSQQAKTPDAYDHEDEDDKNTKTIRKVANKRFLENTIRNSKSYNELLKNNRTPSETVSKKKKKGRGFFSTIYTPPIATKSYSISLPEHSIPEKSRKSNGSSSKRVQTLNNKSEIDAFVYPDPIEPKLDHILVSHSKLRAKSKPKRKQHTDIIKDILGFDVDEGVYGPLPGHKPTKVKITESDVTRLNNGQPSSVLPEKCPW